MVTYRAAWTDVETLRPRSLEMYDHFALLHCSALYKSDMLHLPLAAQDRRISWL